MAESLLRQLFVIVLVVSLAACALPPKTVEPQVVDTFPTDWLTASAEPVALNADASSIDIRVYRAGRLANLGHDHAIEVTGLTGELRRFFDGAAVADLRFSPDALRVDDPAARARAGEGFEQPLDERAIVGTRRNMLGEKVLDAENWPEVRVLARIPSLDAGAAKARVYFSLRGNGRLIQVPVRIENRNDAIQVHGRLDLQQSAFGIEPFSIFGGALGVRDTVEIEFVIAGEA